MKEPTQAQIDEFMEELNRIGKDEIKPKMIGSAFVLMPFTPDCADVYFALQLGLALLLEKPLIVLALEGVYVPKRILELADHVITAPNLEAAKPAVRAWMIRTAEDAKKRRQTS